MILKQIYLTHKCGPDSQSWSDVVWGPVGDGHNIAMRYVYLTSRKLITFLREIPIRRGAQ